MLVQVDKSRTWELTITKKRDGSTTVLFSPAHGEEKIVNIPKGKDKCVLYVQEAYADDGSLCDTILKEEIDVYEARVMIDSNGYPSNISYRGEICHQLDVNRRDKSTKIVKRLAGYAEDKTYRYFTDFKVD